MKAALANDKWFTTMENSFVSNTDGVKRTVIDPEEARAAFDFEITKEQSYTLDGRPIPKHFHLERTDDHEIVPSRGVGDEYKPIQHLSVYDYICNEILPQCPDMSLESVGTMHGGGTGIVSIKMGDTFGITGDKSPYETRLYFINQNNGKGAAVLGTSTVRLFCQNQVAAAMRTASKHGFRIYHSTNAEVKMDFALETVAEQIRLAKDIRDRQERLANIKVGDRELGHMVNQLFPLGAFEEGSRGWTRMLNQREEVIRQFTDGETAQSFEGEKTAAVLFNSFTYPVYNPTRIGKETDLAQIRYSATIGSRQERVNRILNLVEQEVGVAA